MSIGFLIFFYFFLPTRGTQAPCATPQEGWFCVTAPTLPKRFHLTSHHAIHSFLYLMYLLYIRFLILSRGFFNFFFIFFIPETRFGGQAPEEASLLPPLYINYYSTLRVKVNRVLKIRGITFWLWRPGQKLGAPYFGALCFMSFTE